MKNVGDCSPNPEQLELLGTQDLGTPFDFHTAGIVIMDQTGITLYANEVSRQLLTVEDYVLLARKVPNLGLQVRAHAMKDSKPASYLVSYIDLSDAEGRITAYCAVLRPVPDSEQAGKNLEVRLSQLHRSVEQLKQDLRLQMAGDNKQARVPATLSQFPVEALSPEQSKLLADLHADGQIQNVARSLGIGEHSVRNDLRSILRKYGIQSVDELLSIDDDKD